MLFCYIDLIECIYLIVTLSSVAYERQVYGLGLQKTLFMWSGGAQPCK